MRRGPGILIAGGILIVASIILVVLSIYSLASLTESMPSNLSTKNVITATLNANQTAIKASLRSIGVTLGFAFVGILVATILGVDGIIALIGGTVIFFVDRRRGKHHPQTQHQGAPVG
jgi:hypothetical protein